MAQLNAFSAADTAAQAAQNNLKLHKVCRNYGAHAVVKQLDLDIPAGAFVALLGPSGCGKTTTLRMLAGFEAPDAGEIYLGEQQLAGAGTWVPPEKRQMGMVFQSYALWPHLSVADNVGYPLKLRGVKSAELKRRVHEALALVELETRAQAMPQDLSGGQRQRVALARCLVAEPRVILLDEPLANLDRHLRASMEASFREFHRRTGATFVYVTHDQAEAMALADHIAVMHNGQLVQWDSPQNLYAQPRTDWLAGFIGKGSVLRQAHDIAGHVVHGDELAQALLQTASLPARYPVLVRPEHIQLHPMENTPAQGASGANSPALTGAVSECIFKGAHYDVQLRLADGQHLLAYHHSPLALGALAGIHIAQGWGLANAENA